MEKTKFSFASRCHPGLTSWLRVGAHILLPLSGLELVCLEPVPALCTLPQSLRVHVCQSYNAQKALHPCCQPSSLALKTRSASSSTNLLSYEGRYFLFSLTGKESSRWLALRHLSGWYQHLLSRRKQRHEQALMGGHLDTQPGKGAPELGHKLGVSKLGSLQLGLWGRNAE